MNAMLWLSGAVEHDPAIDLWLHAQPEDLRPIATRWFTALRALGDDVLELMHDGCPVACVQDYPFAYVNAFTAHVNLGFFHGASLPDPLHLLEGKGRNMRHVKLKPNAEPDPAALEALIAAAYADI